MSRVIVTEAAALGLERCRLFLTEKNPQVAMRAGQSIQHQFLNLEAEPKMGRPYDDVPEL